MWSQRRGRRHGLLRYRGSCEDGILAPGLSMGLSTTHELEGCSVFVLVFGILL